MNIMRGRTNSGVRLDYYHRIALKTIMAHQSPVTGLFPASPDNSHAWIRDNVYTILSVWGLSMAYKKMADMDEDRAKSYELEQCCVKLMRGLLTSMMLQKDKVEEFKASRNPDDSLHAKFSSLTGLQVVGDSDWGHLQLDAVSLYLLILAQMTAAGLQIIFNLDEVAFIQNLIFYIESAYCIPDYGIWERGDKANHGLPELNASSIGMAKAALEAMNELDLFGARGGPSSVIHVLTDEAQKCQAVLLSMLPRESSSKELDSGLLSIISYPAFAVDDPELISVTRDAIVSKLMGQYGCKRFLRDGYRTPKEDPTRLHYEPCELKIFEKIECEWPLFFCYLIIDSVFQKNKDLTKKYDEALDKLLIKGDDGIKLVPEMYAVRSELASPTDRVPVGKCPFLWAQSLYILGKLLQDGFLAAAELDPLNRRLCLEKKPDVVVQVVILAENAAIREQLKKDDIHVQTMDEVHPIEVQPARVLSHLYTFLGRNEKLGLTGRISRDVGILCTSKLYSLQDKIFAFTPQLTDQSRYYIASDNELVIDICKSEINFLKSSWKNVLGRPTVILTLKTVYLDDGKIPLAMITTMKKLKSGYINGTSRGGLNFVWQSAYLTIEAVYKPWETSTPRNLASSLEGNVPPAYKLPQSSVPHLRVTLGYLKDFLMTSCVTNLSFLGCQELGVPDKLKPEVKKYLELNMNKCFNPKLNLLSKGASGKKKSVGRRVSVKGAIKKTRSIIADIGEGLIVKEAPGGDVSPGPESPPPHQPPWKQTKKIWQSGGETGYGAAEAEDLLTMLRETEHLEEQGDILQYLIHTRGMDHNTGLMEGGVPVTLRDLLKVLYEKACQEKLWGLVRHTAGILGKRVEDLAKAVTDLFVRQKQVTVGMGALSEETITAPLPETELRQLIHSAHGDDQSTAMLTQELLVYLAMFIRTEPMLFKEMLRLRVGLIIQVMAMELSRALGCSGEEASDHLLNLSPYQMKNLLHHIISGKEFGVSSVGDGNISITGWKSSKVSKKSQIGELLSVSEKESEGQQGQWLRRRRLDGALNRVPVDLYSRVWNILDRCEGLAIEGHLLHKNLTQEMTSGELKFALAVEGVLNRVPQPEYRQLLVEALMVLSLVAEHNLPLSSAKVIAVENIVHKANQIFLKEQREVDGDATLCCAAGGSLSGGGLVCGGAAYVCQHFYDSAPSGSYGTITYLAKAVLTLLDCLPSDGELQCNPS